MNDILPIWQYAVMRFELAQHDDRGEVSATTVIWAAALVAVALAVSAILVGKIQSKANSISF
ncbi:MAG: hypothetical protein R2705_23170 [Ilumatobacteraceae bacterium]